MDNFEYIDAAMQKIADQMKEEFDEQIRNLGGNLARTTQRLSNANSKIINLEKQILTIGKLFVEGFPLLNKRITLTNQLIEDILKEAKSMLESL